MSDRRQVTRRPWVEQLEGRLVPSTSSNWSGYAVVANRGAVSAVSGSWVVPAVSGKGNAFSSAWVGIDGDGSGTVEQIGTDSDVSHGTPTYYAWYEMYPAPLVSVSLTIHASDTVSASVTYKSGQFTLQLSDVTTGESFSVSQKDSRARRSSADWVQEAPSAGGFALTLANFGSISFSGAQATINGTTGPVDAAFGKASVDEISMKQGLAIVAAPSALTDSGSPATSSFTVTFHPSSTGSSHLPSFAGGRGRQPDVAALQALPFPTGASSTFAPVGALGSQQGLTALSPARGATNGAPSPAASFGQLGGALGGHTSDAGPADGATNSPPAAPELLPPPDVSDKPADRSGPQVNPDTVPAPSGDESPAGLRGTEAIYHGACDACFVDGRWAPAAPERCGGAGLGGGTGADAAAGVLLGLALGGSWGATRQEGAGRRRRLRGR
jgi:hypothetical protein